VRAEPIRPPRLRPFAFDSPRFICRRPMDSVGGRRIYHTLACGTSTGTAACDSDNKNVGWRTLLAPMISCGPPRTANASSRHPTLALLLAGYRAHSRLPCLRRCPDLGRS
jgi:hypothetical protein